MDLYTEIAYETSRNLALRYSTSFGLSSRLFEKSIQKHIYAIYALARIADEIVDTYRGENASILLDSLEKDTHDARQYSFSTNPVIHAFAHTAQKFHIDNTLIAPFFYSMRLDLDPQKYNDKLYEEYIHGSAEVIGLMCLKVFVEGNDTLYNELASGAKALGSAYQKVNFLRDIAADYNELGRLYFPGVTFETFDNKAKAIIIEDIRNDFAQALPSLRNLPANSKRATAMSYVYYSELLAKLERTDAAYIKKHRMRISSPKKASLFLRYFASRTPKI